MQYIRLAEGLEPAVSRLCCGTQQFSGTPAEPDVTWGWMEQATMKQGWCCHYDRPLGDI
jgi:hypothetical protein